MEEELQQKKINLIEERLQHVNEELQLHKLEEAMAIRSKEAATFAKDSRELKKIIAAIDTQRMQLQLNRNILVANLNFISSKEGESIKTYNQLTDDEDPTYRQHEHNVR